MTDLTNRVRIPSSLQNNDFRFVKISAREKFPFEKSWQKKNNYNWNDPELQDHLDAGGNYGVVGGYGNLVIIDVDDPRVEKAVRENLPKTFTVRTGGGGHHFYFICKDLDKPIRLREDMAGDLGDVQYTGKQVVGPNSIHPNGKEYDVEHNLPIQKVLAEKIRLTIRDFLEDESEAIAEEESITLEGKGITSKIPITDVVPLGGLKRRGEEFQGAHPVHGSTTGHNFCVNPRKNVWHCFRHDTGGGPLSWLAIEEGIISCSEAVKGALKGRKFAKVLEKGKEKELISKEDLEEEPKTSKYFEKGKFIPKLLAEEIMEDYHFITLEDTEEIYAYQKGVFRAIGETIIRSESQARLGKYSRTHHQNEVVNFIQSATYIPRNKLDKDSHKLVVKNGILDLKTCKLKPHSSNPPSIIKIPVKYDSEAECPKIKKFLSEILNHDDIPTVQEGIGYCLLKNYPVASAFMLLGAGANGKSTLLNLIAHFIGSKNVATPSLQDLLVNRFAKAELHGKLANIHADLPTQKLEQTGTFKMLTGGDLIYGEKKFKSAFTFKNHAKLWYSTNELPYTKDRSDAFFRRWILIDFPNTFPKNDPETDPHIIDKITSEKELSGLLNWALKGLHRLLERGDFKKSKSQKEVEMQWILQTDSIRAFVLKRCEKDIENEISKSDFYDTYLDFCNDLGLSAAAKNTVGRRLPSVAPYVRVSRPKISGRRVWCWKGINIYKGVHHVQAPQYLSEKNESNKISNYIDKDTLKTLDATDTTIKAFPRADVSNVRAQIHDWLRKNPLTKKEILLKYSRPEWNLVEAVIKKMCEEGEIFRDEDLQWRLSKPKKDT